VKKKIKCFHFAKSRRIGVSGFLDTVFAERNCMRAYIIMIIATKKLSTAFFELYAFNVQTFNTPVLGLFRLVSRMYLQHAHVAGMPLAEENSTTAKTGRRDDEDTGIPHEGGVALILHYNIIILYSRARRGPKS